MSLPALIAICVAAGLLGAALGPWVGAVLRQRRLVRAPRRRRRRRRTSYYFSDDAQSWGHRRWRRLGAILSVGTVVGLLVISGVVALANYKSRPNAAAGYRS